ncbi:MAG: hypothetical protein Q8Q04_03340 [archaeon]|nr:hypothetical protein [archaeon]
MNGKKGLSQVISTVLLILLTVAIIGGVWAAVNGYVGSSLNRSGACNQILGKVSLNSDYTCYDPSSESVLISISRGEFAMESLLVSVSEELESKSFFLEDDPKTVENLLNYKTLTNQISLPGNESGKTYCFFGFTSKPSLIEISPKRSGNQCQVVDSVGDIPFCPAEITCSGSSFEQG